MSLLGQEHVDTVAGMCCTAVTRDPYQLLALAEASVRHNSVFLILDERIDSRVPGWRESLVPDLLCPEPAKEYRRRAVGQNPHTA